MQIEKYKIQELNQGHLQQHKHRFEYAASEVKNVDEILQKLADFQVAIPSWTLDTGDWAQSLLYATKPGDKAYTLVDQGHHLPNANIEQIVALVLNEGKPGGFHFNDSKYGDDDLTVGSINPYQLFLIF